MADARNTISRPFIAVLVATGLSTSFAPIVTTDVPVHGRSDWSPMDLFVARADHWSPVPGPLHVHLVVYLLATLYVLMAIALLLLALPSPRMALAVVATVGTALSVASLRWGYQDFSWLLYGRFNYAWVRPDRQTFFQALTGWEGFRFDGAYAVLVMVMPALFLSVRGRGGQPALSRAGAERPSMAE